MRDHGIGVRDALGKHIPILGQVPAQGVDALRAASHQKVTGAEHDAVCLLRFAFHRHEATGTKRMPGRWAASQIASASTVSFFCRFTCGLT